MSSVTNATATGTTKSGSSLSASQSKTDATSNDAVADRFLKLLVAQMQNQDPMNPLDNAQVTTQMAQINTVTGLDKVNTSVNSLASQFTQMQTMQATSLVGREVEVLGNRMTVADGKVTGTYDLNYKPDQITISVFDSNGAKVGTVNPTGAAEGRNTFTFDASKFKDDTKLTFKVDATMKDMSDPSKQTAVQWQPIMVEKVTAVGADSTGIVLQLAGGNTVNYSDVHAFR